MKFQVPETTPTLGLSVCFKDSKNVLHEILSNKAWKGRPSTADSAQFWRIG